MDQLLWDVTKAAPVHAAFAGVLATLAIALLAILASIALLPADSNESTAGPSRASVIRSKPQVFRLLVLATFLLLVSAMIWGGLAGQTSVESMAQVRAEAPEDPAASRALFESLDAIQLRESTLAAVAVAILAIGGLSLVAGMFELIGALPLVTQGNWYGFISKAFAVLAVLGAYEIIYFAGIVAAQTWQRPGWAENVVSLLVAAVVALACIPQRLLRAKRRSLDALRQVLRAADIDACQTRIAVLAGVLGTSAYAMSPTSTFLAGPGAINLFDNVATFLTLASSVGAILFAVISSWSLNPVVNPS